MFEQKKLTTMPDNLFEGFGLNTIESKELHFKSTLMLVLNHYIQKNTLSQKQAAHFFGVSQPRMSNLASGRIDLFSTSMLLSMLEKAGYKIYERFEKVLKNAA